MFGNDDVQIEIAYSLAHRTALLGVGYGVMMRNKEDD